MEKTGRVIRMPIRKRNGMQIATVEYDTPEADLCSIKSTDKSTDSRSGCASCGGGCHACGGGSKDGLLVVQGNIVDALNVSGKDWEQGRCLYFRKSCPFSGTVRSGYSARAFDAFLYGNLFANA